jgi:hypothetical protein
MFLSFIKGLPVNLKLWVAPKAAQVLPGLEGLRCVGGLHS